MSKRSTRLFVLVLLIMCLAALTVGCREYCWRMKYCGVPPGGDGPVVDIDTEGTAHTMRYRVNGVVVPNSSNNTVPAAFLKIVRNARLIDTSRNLIVANVPAFRVHLTNGTYYEATMSGDKFSWTCYDASGAVTVQVSTTPGPSDQVPACMRGDLDLGSGKKIKQTQGGSGFGDWMNIEMMP
jgi:hypothetical protein